jgi:hypothetical protein
LRWRIEKKISTRSSQLVWVSRWTKISFGERPSRRSIERWPRWAEPLSTIQNARRADA